MCLDLGPVFGGSGFHRSCQEAPCSLQLSEHLGHDRRKVSEGLLSEGAQIDVSNSNPVDTRDAELLQHRRR